MTENPSKSVDRFLCGSKVIRSRPGVRGEPQATPLSRSEAEFVEVSEEFAKENCTSAHRHCTKKKLFVKGKSSLGLQELHYRLANWQQNEYWNSCANENSDLGS